MEDLLQNIYELKNKILHDGWLIFPPSRMELIVRVEWFIGKKKYGFEQAFSNHKLKHGNINFAELFIERANRGITEYLDDV